MKSLMRTQNGKVAGSSGAFVAGMLKATTDICCNIIADLMNAITLEGKFPTDWRDSINVSSFKGKGDALDWSNYHGLKLTNHVVKVIETVVENITRDTVNIDDKGLASAPVKLQGM